jgi:tetratricopeptide (TPR) repeat protein
MATAGTLLAVVLVLPAQGAGASPAAELPPAYARSLELVNRALAVRPGHPGLLHVLGDVHFRRGRFREAAEVFAELVRVAPQHLEGLLVLGRLHAQLGELKAARETFARVLASASASAAPRAQAHQALADLLEGEGRPVEAADELRRALQLGAGSAESYFQLGKVLSAALRQVPPPPEERRGGMEREAEEALKESVRRDPKHHAARYVLGMLYRRQGKAALAQAELDAFRRLKPAAKGVDLGELKDSEAVFEARTAVQVARVLFGEGDADGALRLLDRALAVKPGFPEALAYKAWIHLRRRELPQAVALYEEVLAADPDHTESLWNLGKTLLEAGDTSRAVALMEKAAELRRPFPEAWELLFQLSRRETSLAGRSEEFGRNALRERPSVENYVQLALFCFESGKRDDALRVVDEGLRRHPRSEELQRGRASILAATGAKP